MVGLKKKKEQDRSAGCLRHIAGIRAWNARGGCTSLGTSTSFIPTVNSPSSTLHSARSESRTLLFHRNNARTDVQTKYSIRKLGFGIHSWNSVSSAGAVRWSSELLCTGPTPANDVACHHPPLNYTNFACPSASVPISPCRPIPKKKKSYSHPLQFPFSPS